MHGKTVVLARGGPPLSIARDARSAEDATNTYMPDGDEKNLRRRDFATYTVRRGQTPVEEMKTLGIKPMVLRAEARMPDSR